MRAFVGYGALGRQIDGLVSELEGPDQSRRFDDILAGRGDDGALPFERHTDESFRDCSFYVCIGYKHPKRKAEILARLLELDRKVPVLCHPTAFVNPSSRAGAGTVIYPMCNVDRHVEIGNGVLLNNSVVISHNVRIGDCCYVSPGAVISGDVEIGANTFVGSGAVVSNAVSIGDDVIVGVGTVVSKDVPSGASVIGNPMRVLRHQLRL